MNNSTGRSSDSDIDNRNTPPLYLANSLSQLFQKGKPHLWLGDGKTVGKLHFDPFDNLLVQLEGQKSFTIIDASQNERLREGHMREAQLEVSYARGTETKHDAPLIEDLDSSIYIPSTNDFRKSKLLESTSMVHSPVDIDTIQSREMIPRIQCTVRAGEVIDKRHQSTFLLTD